MGRIFRLVAFVFIIYSVVSLAPKASSAGDLAPAATAPATSAQRSDASSFPELERRAAAQEGLSDQDKMFLMTAVQGQMLQLELSRVAISRTTRAAVRRFAGATFQFMNKTGSRLNEIAREFGVSLPRTAPDEVENARIALSKSRDSNREYLTRIVADTQQISNLYRDESSRGTNPVIVQFAREMSPRLLQHHRNASRLLATINSPVAGAKVSRAQPASRS
jgi:putative membrane protein